MCQKLGRKAHFWYHAQLLPGIDCINIWAFSVFRPQFSEASCCSVFLVLIVCMTNDYFKVWEHESALWVARRVTTYIILRLLYSIWFCYSFVVRPCSPSDAKFISYHLSSDPSLTGLLKDLFLSCIVHLRVDIWWLLLIEYRKSSYNTLTLLTYCLACFSIHV